MLSACSEASFTGTSSKNNRSAGSNDVSSAGDIKLVSLTRSVDIIVDSDHAKLVLIVDDSSSMADKQQILGNSIRRGLIGLRGKNVEVYLYSTTQVKDLRDPRQTAQMTRSGLGLFSNYTGSYASGDGTKTWGMYLNQYVANPGTTINQSQAPFLYRETYWEKNGVTALADLSKPFDGDGITEIFTAGPSRFSAGTIKLSAQMSETEFNTAIDKIANEVKIGDGGAADGELPLCTLATLLHNDGPYAPFKSGDKVGFFILTDENQANLPCLRKYTAKLVKNQKSNYWPRMMQETTRLPIEIRCDVAGAESWCKTTTDGGYANNKDCVDSNGVSTCALGVSVCNANQLQKGRDVFQMFYASNPKYRRLPESVEAAECRVTGELQTLNFAPIGVPSVISDLQTSCDAPMFNSYSSTGVTTVINKSIMAYFRDLYPKMDIRSCYSDVTIHTESEKTLHNYDEVHDAQTLKNLIISKASKLFGASNYAMFLIGNLGDKNPAGCSALVSAKSTDIINIVGESRSISICEPNYDQALKWFDGFTRNKPRNIFDINNPPGTLRKVEIRRDDGSSMVVDSNLYTSDANGRVEFRTGVLQGGDVIEFFYYPAN